MATTNKRKPRRKPPTVKQMATKVIRWAEDKGQKLIGKTRVAKRARKKPARARRGGRAHAP